MLALLVFVVLIVVCSVCVVCGVGAGDVCGDCGDGLGTIGVMFLEGVSFSDGCGFSAGGVGAGAVAGGAGRSGAGVVVVLTLERRQLFVVVCVGTSVYGDDVVAGVDGFAQKWCIFCGVGKYSFFFWLFRIVCFFALPLTSRPAALVFFVLFLCCFSAGAGAGVDVRRVGLLHFGARRRTLPRQLLSYL